MQLLQLMLNTMKSLLKEFLSAIRTLIKLPFVIFGLLIPRLYRIGWRRLLMLFFTGAILTIILLFSFMKVTSKPGFCGSCHLMRPYIEAWKTSTHRNVDCMQCHARAGLTGYLETKFTAVSMLANYFTGIYKRSKPWAEIEDKNCLGCHQTRLLDGRIEYVKGVHFDHTPHLTEERRGRKLRCTSCHSQIVQGEHISVTTSTCFLCHFKNVKKEGREELTRCISCHIPPVDNGDGVSVKYDHTMVLKEELKCQSCHHAMWQGSGNVRREKCGTCHSSAAHIDKIDDLEFIHEWHIEKRKVECQRCHDAIEHRQPELDKEIRGNCAGCHEDTHSDMSTFYQGIGARLIKSSMPYTMAKSGVVCISCHKESTSEHSAGSNGSISCEPCHPASYRRLATDWHKGFSTRIADIEKMLNRAGSNPQIDDAKHDLELIKKGGSWHNPHFADTLLSSISEIINEAGVHSKTSATIPSASGYCLKCHTTISELNITKSFSTFNHKAHLSYRKISCMECHVKVGPDKPNHGQRKKPGTKCMECHHQIEARKSESCEPCHIPSRNLYFGRLSGEAEAPSPMAEADMTCTDCHLPPDSKAPQQSFCIDCHVQEVVDQLGSIRGELDIALKKSSKKVSDRFKIVSLDKGRAVHHPDLARKVLSDK